jgi:hypothetical protein
MRTKALVCAAVLAAGLASSMAQSNVYSLNVVGYYNVTVPQNGLYMVANQLNTTNNTIQSLLPTVPNDTTLYKYTGGGYTVAQWEDYNPGWDNGAITLNPGETAFVRDPGTPGGLQLTFVGEVLQGSLSNSFNHNVVCFRSSMVPQAASLAVLGIVGENDDTCYVYTGGGYAVSQFEDYNPGWDFDSTGNGPTIAVGQGFGFFKAGPTTAWVRNFTVQ